MTTLRKAAQQALEALKSCSGVPHWPGLQPTIAALRDALALAQEEQEPVAKYSDIVSDGGMDPRNKFDHPPRREWQSLSEEEIRAAYGKDLKYRDGDYERFARAVEAALKDKNA